MAPTARNIGLGAVEQLGGVQRSVQDRARSPQPAPTSPTRREAYTLAYSGAPPSQIPAGAPPPLPPPVRTPQGRPAPRTRSKRGARFEERLRYVKPCSPRPRMEGSASRGARWVETIELGWTRRRWVGRPGQGAASTTLDRAAARTAGPGTILERRRLVPRRRRGVERAVTAAHDAVKHATTRLR